jgi:long-chain acyl-CoA synthetase
MSRVEGDPPLIGEMVERLGRFGGRPALVTDAGTVSYEELLALSHRLADALLRLGLEPGDRFGFLLPNGAEIVAAYYACATTGIVGVPLAARLTDDDLVHQLEDSGAIAVLCGDDFASTASRVAPRLPRVRHWIGAAASAGSIDRDEFFAATSDAPPGFALAPGDPFCVMYTGGTTGVSKAAIQTQRSWGACITDTVEQLGIVEGDRHAVVLPMTHAAWFTAAAHLEVGAVTHLFERWRPEALLELTEREALTKLHMLPTLLGDLLTALAARPTDVGSVELLSLAGSPIPLEMFRRARAAFGDVIANIYGLTEASGPVTYLLPGEIDETRLSSGGRPGRFVELRIDLDPESGEEGLGEVLLRGPQITPGYLDRPEETAASFRDGWFCTGDIGRTDADGFLYIVDRKKEMVKTGGFNVYPKEVEEVLYAHSDVVEAAVFGLPDPRWMEALNAAVVLAPGSAATAADLERFARERLSGYKVPKQIHLVDALPRTGFGKFDKKELVARFAPEGVS